MQIFKLASENTVDLEREEIIEEALEKIKNEMKTFLPDKDLEVLGSVSIKEVVEQILKNE